MRAGYITEAEQIILLKKQIEEEKKTHNDEITAADRKIAGLIQDLYAADKLAGDRIPKSQITGFIYATLEMFEYNITKIGCNPSTDDIINIEQIFHQLKRQIERLVKE